MNKEVGVPALPNRYLIDFDGTLCDTKWQGAAFVMGEPKQDIIDKVNSLAIDNEIIVFTSRPKRERKLVRHWLIKNGVLFDKIKKKPLAKALVDDRAIHPDDFVNKTRGS